MEANLIAKQLMIKPANVVSKTVKLTEPANSVTIALS